MEGLRLLDESQRDAGEAEPAAAPSAAQAAAQSAPAAPSSPAVSGRREEEEDVLLDN
jgi:hypothetical protein